MASHVTIQLKPIWLPLPCTLQKALWPPIPWYIKSHTWHHMNVKTTIYVIFHLCLISLCFNYFGLWTPNVIIIAYYIPTNKKCLWYDYFLVQAPIRSVMYTQPNPLTTTGDHQCHCLVHPGSREVPTILPPKGSGQSKGLGSPKDLAVQRIQPCPPLQPRELEPDRFHDGHLEGWASVRQLRSHSSGHCGDPCEGLAPDRLVDQEIVSPFPDASIQQAKQKACCQKPFGFPCAHVFAIRDPAVCLQLVCTSCF